MVMAMITLPTLPRVSAISAIASRIGGIDISPSITRMMMAVRPSARSRRRGRWRGRRARRAIATAKADRQRHPRAVNHAGIDVAAQHVGAEPELRRWRARAPGRRERRRIDGAKIGREDARSAASEPDSAPPTAMVG